MVLVGYNVDCDCKHFKDVHTEVFVNKKSSAVDRPKPSKCRRIQYNFRH
jgi:hypothetical protein